MVELPALEQNGGISGFSSVQLMQVLTKKSQALRYKRAAASEQFHKDLSNKLSAARMETMKFQAERAMANQESSRVMNSLAGKFSLISKIQQSMG